MLAEEIGTLYERRWFFDADHYPLYHWLLRVCFSRWNIQFYVWGVLMKRNPKH